ncbi:hypothetical protein V865_004949 [Kwoniella europaea PYCC6329]|uniref:Uncharacterized protein n=1 Tax=Kwoniella europaea PYCC6329 TaxID=1423913 RepID=A0AAX4KL20_9TREE
MLINLINQSESNIPLLPPAKQPTTRPSYGTHAALESGAFSYDDEYYEGEEDIDIEEEIAKLEEEYLSAEEEEIDFQMGE